MWRVYIIIQPFLFPSLRTTLTLSTFENCSNTRQLFSVSNGLLGKSKTTPLPSDIPRSALQDRFCMFFSQKIQNIRQDLDDHPSEPATFSPYDGPKLCLFQPVTEEEIRKLIVESPTKTCMLDPIPTSLTKECLSDLLPLITRIVNSSLCSRKGSFNTTAETSVRKRSAWNQAVCIQKEPQYRDSST